MQYTMENGKVINIPDKEIENSMKKLDLSKDEAIELWLEDNGFEINEELEKLDEKAKKVKINHGVGSIEKHKEKKPRTVKISDEKQEIFTQLHQFLLENYENVEILKENKLFSLKIGEKTFKLDLIEQRVKKKT